MLTYNQTSLYLLDYQKLVEAGRTDCSNCIKLIKFSGHLAEGESISCLEAVDSQNVIIGTSRGNIFSFDITEERVVAELPIAVRTRRVVDKNHLASSL